MELSLWQQCLHRLKELVPQQQFVQWISPLQAKEEREKIVLFAPNQYLLEGVSQSFLGLIEHTAISISRGRIAKVEAQVGIIDTKNKTSIPQSKPISEIYIKPPHIVESIQPEAKVNPGNIREDYTFENFVEGKSNQLAKAAALQVAEHPGESYNPLYFYGGVGLGKTHLMHAIGNKILSDKEGAKVVYLHSERFVHDMVKAIQKNVVNEFKKFYRSVDALLIDDIQFFAGKDRSQEEFFYTFNSLLEGQQQIIITSDKFPKEITGIEDRLKSRFGSGLTVAVQPPELETRVAILIDKAARANIELPHEAAFYIAKRVRSNVRELEGALKKVLANARFSDVPITLNFVEDVLQDLFIVHDKLVSIDNIMKTVCEFYKIKLTDIMSKNRARNVSRPRQLAMTLCKELTEKSYQEIGEFFGGRDHTTVLHACKQIKQLCEKSSDIYDDYSELLRTLTS